MTYSYGHGAHSGRSYSLVIPTCTSRRTVSLLGGVGHRHSSKPVVVVGTSSGISGGNLTSDVSHSQHHAPSVSCRAVLVTERQAVASPTQCEPSIALGVDTSGRNSHEIYRTDVAVVGADVAGLAAALAASRANPGARVTLYDTASEPPTACDGGILLSINGLRALKALDPNLYSRIVHDLASPLHEALWFDFEGTLVRRAPLSPPSSSSSFVGGSGGRRRALARQVHVSSEPNPASPPLMISLHDLREALSEALPEEVEIFGRHHVNSVETSTSGDARTVLRFASSPGGSSVRLVRTKLLIGADGPKSAVKRLQFDSSPDQQLQSAGRIVWRGRFTLRKRDPDIARLRNFTTASRTWVDLRAAPGTERTSTLSPAGPNTYVWSASCPMSLLASRGLQELGGASSYWRCLAMFEDFPQDFYAALRATAASAVVEHAPFQPPSPAAAAGLMAPWQWFSGATALVGDAVYSLPVDDASSTAINLALEDASVLGVCMAQHGLTSRALQEYSRHRGPRVSAILAAPPSTAERVRIRDTPFLSHSASASALTSMSTSTCATSFESLSLSDTVAAAVHSAAAVAAAVTSPSQPLEDVLAKVVAAAGANAPGPLFDPSIVQSVDLSRPSGGASRTAPPGPLPAASHPGLVAHPPYPSGLSSPVFSRPSGARRMGPMSAGIAAVISILTAGSGAGGGGRAAHAPAHTGAEPSSSAEVPLLRDNASSSGASALSSPRAPLMTYAVESSPRHVWAAILRANRPGPGPHPRCFTSKASVVQQTARDYDCVVEKSPKAVWQALLPTPGKAHDVLAALPYNAAESPALVWVALLTFSHSALPSVASGAAVSEQQTCGACTLLPRPLMRTSLSSSSSSSAADSVAASARSAVVSVSVDPAPSMEMATSADSSTDGLSTTGSAPLSTPSSRSGAAPLALVGATAATGAASTGGPVTPGSSSVPDYHHHHHHEQQQQQQQRRRKPRSQERRYRRGGQVSAPSGSRKLRRVSVALGGAGSSSSSSSRNKATSLTPKVGMSKSSGSEVAAKAAATMTMSLSAAAALGGVIGAGTGHMPMDMATALHAHGAVAQFWDDLNNLTLSSASLSSIDLA